MKLHVYSAIKKYSALSPVRMHMPGHKGKNDLDRFLSPTLDVTELPVIGNERAVKKAESDCAALLGADNCRFSTDGATSCILTAISGVLKGRDKESKLLVLRSSHKSVYNALKICNTEPVVFGGKADKKSGLYQQITPEDIRKIFEEDEKIVGAVLTYPDYYGRVFDIEGVYRVAARLKKVLILDCAHGAHLPFISGGLNPALYCDVCVFSAHKTLLSLNQGAFICYRDEYKEAIDEAAGVFFTTSPSYPILASVEYGIKSAYEKKQKALKLTDKIAAAKRELKDFGIDVIETEPFKICVDFGAFAGKVERYIEKEGIYPELCDGERILFMLSYATSAKEINRLVSALKEGYKKYCAGKKVNGKVYGKRGKKEGERERATGFLAAVNGEKESIPLSAAEGRIAAECVGRFPPCYPEFLPGERITADFIESYLKKEGDFFGVEGGNVKVLKEN